MRPVEDQPGYDRSGRSSREFLEQLDAIIKELLKRIQHACLHADLLEGLEEAPNDVPTSLAHVDADDGNSYLLIRMPTPPSKRLTEGEKRVARLVRGGLPNKRIADELKISQATVAAYIRRLYRKLDIDDRVTLSYRTLANS